MTSLIYLLQNKSLLPPAPTSGQCCNFQELIQLAYIHDIVLTNTKNNLRLFFFHLMLLLLALEILTHHVVMRCHTDTHMLYSP